MKKIKSIVEWLSKTVFVEAWQEKRHLIKHFIGDIYLFSFVMLILYFGSWVIHHLTLLNERWLQILEFGHTSLTISSYVTFFFYEFYRFFRQNRNGR